MGRIAKLLSFVHSIRRNINVNDATIDPGGGANVTCESFANSGDDSHPLEDDYVAVIEDSGTGREAAVGYFDPLNEHKTAEGEKRIYSRESEGRTIAETHLKNDGTIQSSGHAVDGNDVVLKSTITQNPDGSVEIENDNGSMELKPDGAIVLTTPVALFTVFANGDIRGSNDNVQLKMQADGRAFFENDNGAMDLRQDGAVVLTTPNALFTAFSNGDIKGSNAFGSFELTPAGAFNVNGFIIDPNGNASGVGTIASATIAGGSSLTAGGKEIIDHKHDILYGSSAPGPTGANK